MEISLMLVLIATVVQFVLGALWYSPLLFGKMWMKIMGVDGLSKEELSKMQSEMMPFYALQLVLTLVTTFVFSRALMMDTVTPPYILAFWIWFGYMAPIQIASIIWGNTKKKHWLNQSLIMITYQFVGIMIATYILTM